MSLLEELLVSSPYAWVLQHVKLRESAQQPDAHSLTLTYHEEDKAAPKTNSRAKAQSKAKKATMERPEQDTEPNLQEPDYEAHKEAVHKLQAKIESAQREAQALSAKIKESIDKRIAALEFKLWIESCSSIEEKQRLAELSELKELKTKWAGQGKLQVREKQVSQVGDMLELKVKYDAVQKEISDLIHERSLLHDQFGAAQNEYRAQASLSRVSVQWLLLMNSHPAPPDDGFGGGVLMPAPTESVCRACVPVEIDPEASLRLFQRMLEILSSDIEPKSDKDTSAEKTNWAVFF